MKRDRGTNKRKNKQRKVITSKDKNEWKKGDSNNYKYSKIKCIDKESKGMDTRNEGKATKS